MVAAFTGFLAKDNKPFITEIDAVHHDAILDITKSFPELKGAAQDNSRFAALCDLLEPYILLRNHLAQPVADTTREPNTTRLSYAPPPGLGVNRVFFGDEEAMETEPRNWKIAPSDKPKFDACPGSTRVISSEDATQWRGCPDPWHQQPGTNPDTCSTCGMKV